MILPAVKKFIWLTMTVITLLNLQKIIALLFYRDGTATEQKFSILLTATEIRIFFDDGTYETFTK